MLACLVARRGAVVVMVGVEAEECPVVEAVAFGAVAARDLLPGPCRDLGEQGVGAMGGAACPHAVGAGDRQHIADPAGRKRSP